MKLRNLVLLVLSILAALALSACGGGGDDTTSGGGTDTGSTTAEASVDNFCNAYDDVQTATTALQAASDAEIDQRREALHNFAESLVSLEAVSPDEVAGDVQETADWAKGAEDAVADADTVDAFESAGADYTSNNPEPSEAGQNADKFAKENCS